MNIDWPILAGAIVLLLTPVSWLYPRTARERLSHFHNTRFRLERMLLTWQHWFDLVRAGGGTYFLTKLAVVPDPAVDSGLFLHLAVTAVVLALAVAAQTVHYSRGFYITAPIFFIWGISLGLVDLFPVSFAIVFSAIIARMLDHVDLKLPLFAGLMGVAGYLYGGISFPLILACGLALVPLVLAYGSMSTLVCYSSDLAAE